MGPIEYHEVAWSKYRPAGSLQPRKNDNECEIDMTEPVHGGRRIGFSIPSEVLAEAPMPFADTYWRRCLRVLRMVNILHGKGFQGLRVFPYIYPLAYRIELFPERYAEHDGVRYMGAMPDDDLVARHSGANGSSFFGWDHVADLDAHHLAIEFVRRFPKLAQATFHLDFAYAGWYGTLLAHCEYGYMPYLFSEYEPQSDALRMWCVIEGKPGPHIEWFPFPPTTSAGLALEPRPTPEWMNRE